MDEFKEKMDKMVGNVSIVSGKYDFAFFIILRQMGKKCVLEWCMSLGLIADKVECQCKKTMKLFQRSESSDGFMWCCRERKDDKKHDITRSMRSGSFFQASKTSIINVLMLTYLWVKNAPSTFIVDELTLGRRTVLEWFAFLRGLCVDMCVSSSTMIGGSNVVVEFMECEFGKKKSLRGRRIVGKWIYGGSEVNTGKCVLQVVESKSKDSLFHVIEKYILPGTIIVSDCWSKYRCVEDTKFMHLAKSRNLVLKEPSATTAENSMFGLRSRIEKLPYGNRHISEQFDSHLAEWMWRRLHSDNTQCMFQTFLKEIVNIFPPQLTV